MEKKDIAIPTPCTVDWRKMTPAEGGRFCGDCKKVVRDLSSMRERDARTLLRSAQNSELCVRFLYDKHGKVFFAGDKAPPLVPASFLQRAKRVALAAAAVAVPLSLQACAPGTLGIGGGDDDELNHLAGGLAYDKSWDDHADAGSDADSATTKPSAADAGSDTDGGDQGDAAPTGDGGIDAATADAETPI